VNIKASGSYAPREQPVVLQAQDQREHSGKDFLVSSALVFSYCIKPQPNSQPTSQSLTLSEKIDSSVWFQKKMQ
jgi:hypothetical protein